MTMHFPSLAKTSSDAPVLSSRGYRAIPGTAKVFFERGTSRRLTAAEIMAAEAHTKVLAETAKVLARIRQEAVVGQSGVENLPLAPQVALPACNVPIVPGGYLALPVWMRQPLVLPADWQVALKEAKTPLKIRESKRFGLYRLNRVRPKGHREMTLADIDSASREADYVWARQQLMWLVHGLTGRSLPLIGEYFGQRDHTTVLHAVRKIEALREESPAMRRYLDLIAAEFVGLHLIREDWQCRTLQALIAAETLAGMPAGALTH